MHEYDRRRGDLGQTERPVERRVAAAHDRAALAHELRLLAHEVVQAAPFPPFDPVERELARRKGAVPGRDDQAAGQIRVTGVGAEPDQLLAVSFDRLERAHLLGQA